jgi:hypothetical protein
MGSAAGFLWLAVVLFVLAWVLQLTGTVSLGLNLNIWLPVLLVITLAGAVFNMFVVPFIGRTRTTRTMTHAAGTGRPPPSPGAVPPGAAPPSAPASGSVEQEVMQETRDKPTL